MSPRSGDEPRTARQMRLAIREAEETLRLLQEADMMAGDWEPDWKFTAARAKLRAAERLFAKKDQHPDKLKPLSPRVRPRPVSTQPNRRRYRCTGCFVEHLFYPEHVGFDGEHHRIKDTIVADGDQIFRKRERVLCGEWEPVARMPRRKESV